MKKILISMYSLNIGGAERSLIGLLDSFDYKRYDVDLFLYRKEGEFLKLIPSSVNLLPSIPQYTTFERPVKDILKEGHIYLSLARVLAKLKAKIKNKKSYKENGTYKIMQYTWNYSLLSLPKLKQNYDLAIGFLGPHDFIIHKVKAKVKIGWNHTDYFTIVNPDMNLDRKMWSKLDYIVNVSEDCKESFLKIFPEFCNKTIVIENILSPNFIKQQSKGEVKDEMPDNGSVKICSVGRFSYEKGFDMAVLACRLLKKSSYKISWYVIGYGTDEHEIISLINKLNVKNEFVLLGKKANPYPYMRECDIYCQPSRCEGKAVTVREAQILGKPVVITNFPTSKSQLEDGVDGHICALSAEGIADGIKKLIDDSEFRKSLTKNELFRDYGNQIEINKIYKLTD